MQNQKGFTLIEILIAVIVLAVGLLGIAGMQTKGIRANQSAHLRSQATVLAYEIVDRMRSNRDRDSNKLNELKEYETDFDDSIKSTPDCKSNSCDLSQMVAYDIAQWKDSLELLLPSGAGAITVSQQNDVVIAQVRVRWDDTRGEGGLKVFSTQTRL